MHQKATFTGTKTLTEIEAANEPKFDNVASRANSGFCSAPLRTFNQ